MWAQFKDDVFHTEEIQIVDTIKLEILMNRILTSQQESLQNIDGVLALPDTLRRVSMARRLDEALDLYRVSCPIGVLCVIFEARPDAAVQIAALAIKSAFAVIL